MSVLRFETWQEKAAWLQRAAYADAHAPAVVALARAFVASYPDPRERAHALHRWVRDTIRYRRDPLVFGRPREQFASSEAILRRGFDDCDGKARLFVALAAAAGLAAVVVPIVERGELVHFRAAVASETGWIPAELIVRGVELGQPAEAGERDGGGRLLMS